MSNVPSAVTQLRRARVRVPSNPHMPLLERSLRFERLFPQLYTSPANMYKVLLDHRLSILSHRLVEDPEEADMVIAPTLQMRKTGSQRARDLLKAKTQAQAL